MYFRHLLSLQISYTSVFKTLFCWTEINFTDCYKIQYKTWKINFNNYYLKVKAKVETVATSAFKKNYE